MGLDRDRVDAPCLPQTSFPAGGLPANRTSIPPPANSSPRRPAVRAAPSATQLRGAPDLKTVEEFIQPDDGNRRPHGRPLSAAPSDRAGEWVELEIEFSAAPGDLRPYRRPRRLRAGRPVVPQDRRLRAGRDARPCPGRLERPPVPRQQRVLRRLRRLRRSLTLPARYQGKIGATGRLVEEMVEGDDRQGALCPARCARLRMDRRPAVPGDRGYLRPGGRRAGRAAAVSPRCSGFHPRSWLHPVDIR